MRRSLATCLVGLLALAAPAARGQGAAVLVDHLPRDPLLAGSFEIGDPNQWLEGMIELVKRFDTEGELASWEEEMAKAEAELGCALRRDLLAQLGPDMAFSLDLPPIDELMAGMEDPAAAIGRVFERTGLLTRVRDGAAVDACLRQLVAAAEMSISEEDGLVRIAPPAEAAAEAGLPPGTGFFYAIRGGHAAFSASPRFVRATLGPRPEGQRLRDGADFRQVFAHLEGSPQGLSYLNLPKMRQMVQESGFVQGVLTSDPGAQPLLELMLAPEYTGMGLGTTTVEVDGGVRRMSYGPPALSGGMASTGIVAAILVPNLLEALDKAKRKRTTTDIRTIAVGLEMYAVEAGGYPKTEGAWREAATLTDILVPEYLPELPASDGWGHPLMYWSDGLSYRLASPGKDGQMDRDWLTAASADGEPGEQWELDLVYSGSSFLVATAPDG